MRQLYQVSNRSVHSDDECSTLKVNLHYVSILIIPIIGESTYPDWCYATGRVNKAMIEQFLPPPGEDTVILLCGPPGLVKETCLPALKDLGYSPDSILVF